MIQIIQQFLNGNSKNLNVNGSIAQKTFSYTASGSAMVSGLICVLKDEGSTSFDKFGAMVALTNGVLIQVTQANVTTTIATIKDNADMCMVFPQNQFGNGAVLSILALVTPEGFGNTNNCFVGSVYFDYPVNLQDGDSISVYIQDNLTNIDVFQMSCRICKDS